MADAAGRRLDDEQREQVRDCLKKARISPAKPFDLDKFVSKIESTIDYFRRAVPRAVPKARFREKHDILREIWILAQSRNPDPARLRKLLGRLRPQVTLTDGAGILLELDSRAEILVPRLFPGEKVERGFLAWAGQADDAKLVTALEAISADGAQPVKGRSRGKGKRGRPRLEPRVLGLVRGSGQRKPKGGRPSDDARQQLVMFLACDWLLATGQAPAGGRSDELGFGDLVHSVFQWLEISDDPTEAATYALRHWSEAKKALAASPEFADSLRPDSTI
jgi:hypothetical protein